MSTTAHDSEFNFTVRDLEKETWPDFERFFAKYNGVQAGCWCMYYHRSGQTPGKTIEERMERNHEDKKNLVLSNQSRGILIYSGNDVIASCQYGTRKELPRIDNGRNYRNLNIARPEDNFWRITCFFVDKKFRKKGITGLALRAVLSRIQELGGGVVEAYPVTNFRTVAVWFGSVSTFASEGFEIVGQLGKSNVVMQRFIASR